MATLVPPPRDALSSLLRSTDFQRFEAELARASAFHVLGIERRELSHAALLGWLLNPRAPHGLGTLPLRSFLMLASGLSGGRAPGPDAVAIDGLDIHSAQIELERAIRVPGSRKGRRIDLVVSIPHGDATRAVLVVEYKVDAMETDDQTVDYANWARGLAQDHDWPTLPLLVYLCPGQGQPTSDDFVVMDYDAYVPWLEELLAHRPSVTAEFLLQEFRACLSRRDDVQDERQEALRAQVVTTESAAIEVLARVSSGDLGELWPTVLRHREALNALGLFLSRQSKGHSAFVVTFRQVLQAMLDPAVWRVGGGEGSLVAIYLPAVELLHRVTGETRGPSSALRVHLFMERPKQERARAVLEVIGNHPQLDAVESKALRMRLAEKLRERVAHHLDQPARGQIVAAFVLSAPGIKSVTDDVDARVDGLDEQFQATAQRVRALGDALQTWLPALEGALIEVA